MRQVWATIGTKGEFQDWNDLCAMYSHPNVFKRIVVRMLSTKKWLISLSPSRCCNTIFHKKTRPSIQTIDLIHPSLILVLGTRKTHTKCFWGQFWPQVSFLGVHITFKGC